MWVTYCTRWGHSIADDPPPMWHWGLGAPGPAVPHALRTLHTRRTTVLLCQRPPFPGEPPSHTSVPMFPCWGTPIPRVPGTPACP